MAEPAASAAVAASVASPFALAVAAFGPLFGPYALIVGCALAGALWALGQVTLETRRQAAYFLLRIVLTAAAIGGTLAWAVERYFDVPAQTSLAAVSFLIGLFGHRWPQLMDTAFAKLRDIISTVMPGRGNNGGSQ